MSPPRTAPPCLCVFLIITSITASLSPPVSLQWEQMQQAEDECAAPRGVETLAQPRCSAMTRKRKKNNPELIWQRHTANPHPPPVCPPVRPSLRRSVRSHSRRAAVLLQVPAHRGLPGVLQPGPHGQTLFPEGGALTSADTSCLSAQRGVLIKRLVLSPQHHGKIRKTNFLKKNEKVTVAATSLARQKGDSKSLPVQKCNIFILDQISGGFSFIQ